MSELQIGFADAGDGDITMVVTGMSVGHAPALANALYKFVEAERKRFAGTDGTSGVGHTAEEFLAALDKARGF